MKKLILLSIIVVCFSCKKKDDPQPASSASQGNAPVVYGCMNPAAYNYNSQATSDACNCPCTFRAW